MEAEKGSTVRSSSPVGGIETAHRVTDLFAAIVGLLVVATSAYRNFRHPGPTRPGF